MKQKIFRKKQNVMGIAAMLLLTAFTFQILISEGAEGSLREAIGQADLKFAAMGLFCMFVFAGCEAASLRTLMRTFGRKVRWTKSLDYAFANFYFSAITPSATGGQPMQLYYMTRDRLGFSQSSFCVLATAAVYQMTVLGYGAAMVILKRPYLADQPAVMKWLVLLGMLANGAAAAAIFLIIFCRPLMERAAVAVIAFLGRIRLVKDVTAAEIRVEGMIDEYGKGAVYLRRYPRVLLKIILLTVVQLTALFLVPYFACLSLGISEAGALDFIALQAVLSLAVSAIPLPGSVGASEGSFLVLYSGVLAASHRLPVLVLSRGISFYGFLVVSGLMTARLQICRGRSGAAGLD